MICMDLKSKIMSIVKDIESINIEKEQVGCDDEDYQNCLNYLGESVDYLHGIIYYLEKYE